jgi:hypothetical protein
MTIAVRVVALEKAVDEMIELMARQLALYDKLKLRVEALETEEVLRNEA